MCSSFVVCSPASTAVPSCLAHALRLKSTPVNTKTRVLLQSSSLRPLGKSPSQEGRGYQIRASAQSSSSQNSDLTLILPGLTRQVKLSLNFATARNSFHFLPWDSEMPMKGAWGITQNKGRLVKSLIEMAFLNLGKAKYL